MKRIILTALFGLVALIPTLAAEPNLFISGVEGNYAIGSFAKGSVVFLNRIATQHGLEAVDDGAQQ